jgi:hypothetical protein
LNRGAKNEDTMMRQNPKATSVQLNWNKTGTNKEIISELKDRLLFQTDDYSQADFEKILKYDFDPKTAGSENAVMRLFNYMIKTPEFQLIKK